MTVQVRLEDLVAAYEWVSACEAAALDCVAYVSRTTGTVHWSGEGVDEELPADIEDENLYIAVPDKSEFNLGRSLALRFTENHLPASYDVVCGYFRKRGAYGRFKSLLAHAGQLEVWHRYQEAATEQALREWCEENGLAAQ